MRQKMTEITVNNNMKEQSGGSAIVFVIIGSALDKIGFKKNVAKGI